MCCPICGILFSFIHFFLLFFYFENRWLTDWEKPSFHSDIKIECQCKTVYLSALERERQKGCALCGGGVRPSTKNPDGNIMARRGVGKWPLRRSCPCRSPFSKLQSPLISTHSSRREYIKQLSCFYVHFYAKTFSRLWMASTEFRTKRKNVIFKIQSPETSPSRNDWFYSGLGIILDVSYTFIK